MVLFLSDCFDQLGLSVGERVVGVGVVVVLCWDAVVSHSVFQHFKFKLFSP